MSRKKIKEFDRERKQLPPMNLNVEVIQVEGETRRLKATFTALPEVESFEDLIPVPGRLVATPGGDDGDVTFVPHEQSDEYTISLCGLRPLFLGLYELAEETAGFKPGFYLVYRRVLDDEELGSIEIFEGTTPKGRGFAFGDRGYDDLREALVPVDDTEVSTDGRTVWVNTPRGCIGGFCSSGYEIWAEVTGDLIDSGGPDWETWNEMLQIYYGVTVPEELRPAGQEGE